MWVDERTAVFVGAAFFATTHHNIVTAYNNIRVANDYTANAPNTHTHPDTINAHNTTRAPD